STIHPLAPSHVALAGRRVSIECLHPPAGEALSANDSSLVLRLRFREHAMLFPGDLESAGEGLVTSRFPPLGVSVLKVPHHGSATSSTERLLRWANPGLAVFSLGAGNSYGFPHPTLVERYRR